MVETLVLVTFATALVIGIVAGIPLLAILIGGFFLFAGYGLYRGNSVRSVLSMAGTGFRTIGSVLMLFVIIGMLTASWRAAGTIPAITCWSTKLVSPPTLVLLSFLLCAMMSFITGSSFAAAATTGVICVTIGTAMHVSPALLGGAVMSGCFFGDRCSPLSSAAALVATLTRTQVLDNVKRMLRSAVIPVALCVVLYAVLGVSQASSAALPNFESLFAHTFDLSWYVFIPIAIVLVLSLLKVSVKKTMLASLACALVLCVTVQHIPLAQIPYMLVFGFHTRNEAIARMVNGGGIVSMLDIVLIVGVASTYSGIFEGTGLLLGLRDYVNKVARNYTPFVSVLATSVATCTIACDQVVALMLTSQLCDQTERDGSALALDLENSAAIIPALIPWSTSCIGIIAFLGLPTLSVLFTFLCWLIPLWTLALSAWEHRHPEFVDTAFARAMGLDARDDVRRFHPDHTSSLPLRPAA